MHAFSALLPGRGAAFKDKSKHHHTPMETITVTHTIPEPVATHLHTHTEARTNQNHQSLEHHFHTSIYTLLSLNSFDFATISTSVTFSDQLN